MKRKALLIGAPGTKYSNKYLQGVDFDIKNYIQFLRSPTGGAWEKDEIIAVRHPEKNLLKKTAQAIRADYFLIVFSGHGAYSHQGGTFLAINREQIVTLNELITKVPKQLFIIDTCRSFIDSGISGFLGEELREFPSRLTRNNARNLYDSHLKRCENGTIICYSSSVGERSIDSNYGGYFTTSLLDSTVSWVKHPSRFNILPINQAFYRATNYLNTYLTQKQNPQLKISNRRKNWFPFAIRSNNDILGLNE